MNQIRLRAPSSDGALLAIPPLRDSVEVLSENRAKLAEWDYDFQGRSASVLRAKARAEVVELARAFRTRYGLGPLGPSLMDALEDESAPWVVTGHQPELFHPGVWVKNFAAADIARKAHGISLNVIVDNDLPKGSSILVPSSRPDGLHREEVAFDEWPEQEVPFEDLTVGDESVFSSFPSRVRKVWSNIVPDPLMDEFWPIAMSRRETVSNIGLRFALARHEMESRWGTDNLEVPLSQICQSDSFLWFLSHLLAQLPRYQEIHNSALREYRRLYRIRSRNHPVADLETHDDWREAPFWIWRADRPRRQPLLVRQLGRTMQLRIAGESEVIAELPLAPDREACCAVEILRQLPERSIRLRTRALTTTLFCRFLLGDIFLHGIGGAKYDELGDSIAERFFETAPPSFLTLSQTLWLGLPFNPSIQDSLDQVRHRLRDVDFNPDRLLTEPIPPEIHTTIEAKRRAISGPQETSKQRKARWRELRGLNESLQSHVEDRRDELRDQLHLIQQGMKSKRVATSREYSMVLHSREKMREAMKEMKTKLSSAQIS